MASTHDLESQTRGGQHVVVAHAMSLAEAESIRSVLQAAGLAPRLRDGFTASINWLYIPALGGVRVEIPAMELERATEVLADDARVVDAVPELLSTPSQQRDHLVYLERASRRRRTRGLIALFLVAPWLGPLGLLLAFGPKGRSSSASG